MNTSILITGSTDGIGKLAALHFAKAGYTVYVHGRNDVKVASVVSELKKASENQNINGLVADFSDLEAVTKLAEQLKNELPRLDILINNAGILKTNEVLTKKGLDFRIVVNYLAPFVLTNALLPILKQSDSPRIINLSSASQEAVSESVLTGEETQSERSTYAQSKLALTMWSFYLAKQEPTITVIALNPGSLLNTKMVQEAYGEYWSPAEKGVAAIVDLALSQAYNNDSGKYFDNDKGTDKGYFAPAHADAYDTVKIAHLLAVTKDLIKG